MAYPVSCLRTPLGRTPEPPILAMTRSANQAGHIESGKKRRYSIANLVDSEYTEPYS